MTDQTFAQVMMSGVVRFASVIAVVLAVALATMTEAVTRHTGVGIARRAAFHERLRAERAELKDLSFLFHPPIRKDGEWRRGHEMRVTEAATQLQACSPA